MKHGGTRLQLALEQCQLLPAYTKPVTDTYIVSSELDERGFSVPENLEFDEDGISGCGCFMGCPMVTVWSSAHCGTAGVGFPVFSASWVERFLRLWLVCGKRGAGN